MVFNSLGTPGKVITVNPSMGSHIIPGAVPLGLLIIRAFFGKKPYSFQHRIFMFFRHLFIFSISSSTLEGRSAAAVHTGFSDAPWVNEYAVFLSIDQKIKGAAGAWPLADGTA